MSIHHYLGFIVTFNGSFSQKLIHMSMDYVVQVNLKNYSVAYYYCPWVFCEECFFEHHNFKNEYKMDEYNGVMHSLHDTCTTNIKRKTLSPSEFQWTKYLKSGMCQSDMAM